MSIQNKTWCKQIRSITCNSSILYGFRFWNKVCCDGFERVKRAPFLLVFQTC